jgi:SSS family solute:Na+ symporter
MNQLPIIDLTVMAVYLLGVVAFGCWFVRKSRSVAGFTAAGGMLPGWAVGLSIFGTFLSSNTFVGVPGKAFGGNWNFFVFSLALPFAAWIGVKYFVPFYRHGESVSAYHHLEQRFGPWARTYAVIIFLLSQIARIGGIAFGVSLALSVVTGWDIRWIIVISGLLVTLYTMVGGITAVIWTDVVQTIVLTAGALLVLIMLWVAGDTQTVWQTAVEHEKFSFGNWELLNVSDSTVWVVFLFGLGVGLNRFGIDQSYIQRYHAARDEKQARQSLWVGGLLYIPVSLIFFLIGTGLFGHYLNSQEPYADLKQRVAEQRLMIDGQLEGKSQPAQAELIESRAQKIEAQDVSDKAFPHYMAYALPPGVAGLLIAALFAAAMSSIDTSLNSSATITYEDIYRRYLRPRPSEGESMLVLYGMTALVGAVGIGVALLMVGVTDLLQVIWMLESILFGATLGLFLLGFCSRTARSAPAAFGVTVGLLAIIWTVLTLPRSQSMLPPAMQLPDWAVGAVHSNMIIVIGTLTIYLIGWLASQVVRAQ